MTTIVVYIFFILAPTLPSAPQAIDGFPSLDECNRFRNNVVAMIQQGAAPRATVTDCEARKIVKP